MKFNKNIELTTDSYFDLYSFENWGNEFNKKEIDRNPNLTHTIYMIAYVLDTNIQPLPNYTTTRLPVVEFITNS